MYFFFSMLPDWYHCSLAEFGKDLQTTTSSEAPPANYPVVNIPTPLKFITDYSAGRGLALMLPFNELIDKNGVIMKMADCPNKATIVLGIKPTPKDWLLFHLDLGEGKKIQLLLLMINCLGCIYFVPGYAVWKKVGKSSRRPLGSRLVLEKSLKL